MQNRGKTSVNLGGLALVILLLIAIFAAAIYLTTAGNSIGADIFVFYLSAKSSFNTGEGPYFGGNFKLIQQQLLAGQLTQAGSESYLFSYPPYALLPVFPLTILPFAWAQAVWMATLLIGLCTVILFSFPQAPKWIPLLVLFLYPVAFGVLMGNSVILISIFLIANIKHIFFRQYPASKPLEIVLAVLLAWSSVKPQVSWLFIVVILIAAIEQRRRLFLLSFAASLAFFFLLSFAIWPNWIPDWLSSLNLYRQTNPSELFLITLLKTFLPANIAHILAIPLILMGLAWLVRTIWGYWHKYNNAIAVLIVTALLSTLLYPGGVAYRQLVFVIPFVTWLLYRGSPRSLSTAALLLAAILISWAEFTLTRLAGVQLAFNEWLFSAYVIWAIPVLIQQYKPAQSGSLQPM